MFAERGSLVWFLIHYRLQVWKHTCFYTKQKKKNIATLRSEKLYRKYLLPQFKIVYTNTIGLYHMFKF